MRTFAGFSFSGAIRHIEDNVKGMLAHNVCSESHISGSERIDVVFVVPKNSSINWVKIELTRFVDSKKKKDTIEPINKKTMVPLDFFKKYKSSTVRRSLASKLGPLFTDFGVFTESLAVWGKNKESIAV